MRVVFMGTPDLAQVILTSLAQHHDVSGALTRPDAIRGRGSRLVASPVKARALELGIPVFTPSDFKDEETLELLARLDPDVICVSAYGMILPREVLDLPRFGCLNVHTSLLPRWRGAAPIERSILAGDDQTGVCIMKMEPGLDTGPYCVRKTVSIDGYDAASLTDALAHEGADALLEALDLVESGNASWIDQGEDGISYAAKIAKGELNPTPSDSTREFISKVRASSAAHPARASIAKRNLAIEEAIAVTDDVGLRLCEGIDAGEARFRAKRLFLGVSEGAVEVRRVRPDGKKSMEAKAFAGGIQGVKTANIRWGRM